MSSPRVRFWAKAGVSLAVLGGLLWLLPWPRVVEAAARVTPGLWIGVLAGFTAGHLLGTLKWRTMVNAAARGPVLDVRSAGRCYGAGLFANLYLPSIVGGDVLRGVMAGRSTGSGAVALFGGVADRVLDVTTLALLVTAGALLTGRRLAGWDATTVALLVVGLLAAVVVLGRVVTHRPLERWPARHRRRVARGLVALRRMGRVPLAALLALTLSLLVQGGFVLLNWAIGSAVGIAIPLVAWFVAWPLAKIAGLLPVSLGGLGVRDAALAATLAPLGVPAASAVVTSLVWQTIVMAGGLLGGLVWWRLR